MSGVKHTGWKADCGFHRHDPKMTCSVRITSGTVQVKTEDEARLIAAAPDLEQDGSFLLDRLDEFAGELQDDDVARQFYGHVSPALARFRAAVARARGEQDGGGE